MWAACALQSVGVGSEQAVSSDFSSTCCNKLHACVIGMLRPDTMTCLPHGRRVETKTLGPEPGNIFTRELKR